MGELAQEPVRLKGDPASATRLAYSMGAGEQFCQVLGIPILRGRDFDITDRTRRPAPALVNHTQLIVRTADDAARWVVPLRDLLAQAAPASALDIRPLSDAAAGAAFPMRVAAGFVVCMGAIGLLTALSGLFSSVSYAAKRRTREMAIRLAVGATRPAILWTAIRDAIAALSCAIVVGLPLAIGAIRPLATILPDGLDPWSPMMFTAVIFVLLATGAAAAWIAVRSTFKMDPSFILRHE